MNRHLPGLLSRKRINVGHQGDASAPTNSTRTVAGQERINVGRQDGASAPTNSTRTVAGQERINVGRQDGASAPTHHLHSPRPYAGWTGTNHCSRTAQAPPTHHPPSLRGVG